MEKNKIQEEVTITPVIRDLERLFIKVFQLIIFIFKSIGDLFFYLFKTIITKLSFFIVFTFLGISLFLASFAFFPKVSESSLILKLNVNSKAQLINDISYIKTLVKRGQHERLAELLSLTVEEAKSITDIQISPYASFLEQLDIYNKLYASLDTNVRRNLNFNSIINQEENLLTDKIKITVYSTSEEVFSKIEIPILSFLERVPELQDMRNRQLTNLIFEKEIFLKELADLDTLKKVYNQSLKEAAKVGGNSQTGTTISLGKAKNENEFTVLDIHTRYINYSNELRKIKLREGELKTVYLVHSHFNSFGKRSNSGYLTRIVFGALTGILFAFFVLFFAYFSKKVRE